MQEPAKNAGDYEIFFQDSKGPLDERVPDDTPVARRVTLELAMEETERLARKAGVQGGLVDELTWKTVNPGTQPGHFQVYQLIDFSGRYTGWHIHGPHVGGK